MSIHNALKSLCLITACLSTAVMAADASSSQPRQAEQRQLCIEGVCITNILKEGHRNVLKHCPDVHMLTHNKMYWGAPGGWMSHDESFVKKISNFVAAQWQGINIGKVMCVYVGDKGLDFPVVLQQSHADLVPEPHGLYWGKNQNGVINCISPSGDLLTPKSCAYIIKQPVPNTDPTATLNFFKNGHYQRVD